MNIHYFSAVGFEEAKRAVTAITGENGIEGIIILMDDWKVHNPAQTTERAEERRT
jgi:hypothetical protein